MYVYQPGNISWIMAIGAFFVFLYLDIKDWWKHNKEDKQQRKVTRELGDTPKTPSGLKKRSTRTSKKAEEDAAALEEALANEPSPHLQGFLKGMVVAYVVMTFAITVSLLIMLLLDQDVTGLVSYVAGQEIFVNPEENPILVAFSLQKEFTLIKLAVAGCMAGFLRRLLVL